MTLKIQYKRYQAEFADSTARFPAIISSVGTGKTLSLLLKVWRYCEKYPNSLALIIRKEFTDLKDSTMSDFQNYFNVKIGSDKNFTLPNGSKILFRHGDELNVLKNLNLSIIGIEQAEEFETEDTFDFLRDRLRRNNAPYRQLCIIANARGHNWVWRRFIQAAERTEVYDARSGVAFYKNNSYEAWTANTLANEDNLPPDFLADLMSMEHEAPNHFAQYVMNSFEDLEEDDLLYTFGDIEGALKADFIHDSSKYDARVMGGDIARYGQDKCCATIIKQVGPVQWEVEYMEEWAKKDLMHTVGRFMDIRSRFQPLITVIDGDGMGAGPVDRMKENGIDVVEFRNGAKAKSEEKYEGRMMRDQMHFDMHEMIQKGWLRIKPEYTGEMQTLRFEFDSKGRKKMMSKEKMKTKYEVKSPNRVDSLAMAVTEIENVGQAYKEQHTDRMPRYAVDNGLYGAAGIR